MGRQKEEEEKQHMLFLLSARAGRKNCWRKGERERWMDWKRRSGNNGRKEEGPKAADGEKAEEDE